MNETKSVFETLSAINVNDKVEQKQGLNYLSWAWAWAEVKKACPTASYKVYKDPLTNNPYIEDPILGYLCSTSVTIEGETLEMWLPVMNGANKAMKALPYSYMVKGWNGAPDVQKEVEAASMFDVNKTIMRCLVKNFAMFGLGHYIYAGEDLPEGSNPSEIKAIKKPEKKYEEDTRPWLKENELTAALKGNAKQAANVIKSFRMKKEYKDQLNTAFSL
jgi:hypothetical protein